MNDLYSNPYHRDSEEFLVWEVLIKNDFEGFLGCDWGRVADDFIEQDFFGIDMAKSTDATCWKLTYPTLDDYKKQWLSDSVSFHEKNFISDPRQVLYETTRLENFDLKGDTTLVHKVFDGLIELNDEPNIIMKWRSLFLMKRVKNNKWKVSGFCGYIHEK